MCGSCFIKIVWILWYIAWVTLKCVLEIQRMLANASSSKMSSIHGDSLKSFLYFFSFFRFFSSTDYHSRWIFDTRMSNQKLLTASFFVTNLFKDMQRTLESMNEPTLLIYFTIQHFTTFKNESLRSYITSRLTLQSRLVAITIRRNHAFKSCPGSSLDITSAGCCNFLPSFHFFRWKSRVQRHALISHLSLASIVR